MFKLNNVQFRDKEYVLQHWVYETYDPNIISFSTDHQRSVDDRIHNAFWLKEKYPDAMKHLLLP
jgi:5'(3')-deoxyribonucleotidase